MLLIGHNKLRLVRRHSFLPSAHTVVQGQRLNTTPHDSGWKVTYSIPSVPKQRFWLFTVYMLCLLAGQGWGCGAEAAAETRLVAAAAEKGSNSISLCHCLNPPKLSLILIILLKAGTTWNSMQVLSLRSRNIQFCLHFGNTVSPSGFTQPSRTAQVTHCTQWSCSHIPQWCLPSCNSMISIQVVVIFRKIAHLLLSLLVITSQK